MKDEAELNLIIKKALGWGSKIPDPSSDYSTTIQRPFDGFGILNDGIPIYWEGKFLTSMKSFNLQDIKDHQIDNLCAIKTLNPSVECWIILGVKVGRGDNRIYLFKDPFYIRERRLNKDNFFKKELESLHYLSIKKGAIPPLHKIN